MGHIEKQFDTGIPLRLKEENELSALARGLGIGGTTQTIASYCPFISNDLGYRLQIEYCGYFIQESDIKGFIPYSEEKLQYTTNGIHIDEYATLICKTPPPPFKNDNNNNMYKNKLDYSMFIPKIVSLDTKY